METNDFLGSFAQENVSFSIQMVKKSSTSFGQNFWTLGVYVESDRFVDTTTAGWEAAPGLDTCKVLVVTVDTYADYTTGLLQSWLYDFFANDFDGQVLLIAPAASQDTPQSADDFQTAMEAAFAVLKTYAYHVTVCAGGDDAIFAPYAVALANLCKAEDYLVGAPLLPCIQTDLTVDPIHSALTAANADAFMAWHSDSTRNGALYSLGLAMATLNRTLTVVGNQLDMIASTNITPSNGGANPTPAQKTALKAGNVQYFKTVGDNSGAVAAESDVTIQGKVYAAYWVRAYIIYMSKVRIARLITQRGFNKSAYNYLKITSVIRELVDSFVGANILSSAQYSYPAFGQLPEAEDDEIVVEDAWSAYFESHVRKVKISGAMYIGG